MESHGGEEGTGRVGWGVHVNFASEAVACGGSIALEDRCLIFFECNYNCGLHDMPR